VGLADEWIVCCWVMAGSGFVVGIWVGSSA